MPERSTVMGIFEIIFAILLFLLGFGNLLDPWHPGSHIYAIYYLIIGMAFLIHAIIVLWRAKREKQFFVDDDENEFSSS